MTYIPWSDDAYLGWEGFTDFQGTWCFVIHTWVGGPRSHRLTVAASIKMTEPLDALTAFVRAACSESEETRLERELRERWGWRFEWHHRDPMIKWTALDSSEFIQVTRPTKLAALRALAAATKALDGVE